MFHWISRIITSWFPGQNFGLTKCRTIRMSWTASFKSVHQRSGSKHPTICNVYKRLSWICLFSEPKRVGFISWADVFFSYAFASCIHSSMHPVFLAVDFHLNPNSHQTCHLALLVFRQNTVPSPGCCSCPVSLHIAILAGTVLQQLQQQLQLKWGVELMVPSQEFNNIYNFYSWRMLVTLIDSERVFRLTMQNLGFQAPRQKILYMKIQNNLLFSLKSLLFSRKLCQLNLYKWCEPDITQHDSIILLFWLFKIWVSHAPCHHKAAAPFGIGM